MNFREMKQMKTSKFAAHHAVIERIVSDVALTCADSYLVTRARDSEAKLSFSIVFFPKEISIDSYKRIKFSDYGMGEMRVDDLKGFSEYFHSIFVNKFRAELNKENSGRYEFTVEDDYHPYMFDAKWWLKVTVWFKKNGLTAW